MDAADMPCHAHAIDKADCGACCGPIVTQQAMLAVAPVFAAFCESRLDGAPDAFGQLGASTDFDAILKRAAPH